MSRWTRGSDEQAKLIQRALIVGEYGDCDALEYLGHKSRADTRSCE